TLQQPDRQLRYALLLGCRAGIQGGVDGYSDREAENGSADAGAQHGARDSFDVVVCDSPAHVLASLFWQSGVGNTAQHVQGCPMPRLAHAVEGKVALGGVVAPTRERPAPK